MTHRRHRLRVNGAAMEGRQRRQAKLPVNSSVNELHHEIRCAESSAIVAAGHNTRNRNPPSSQRLENGAFPRDIMGAMQQCPGRLLA